MPRRATDPEEALFRAFERVPRPGPIDACRCCLSEQDERAVLAPVPLRNLPRAAIAPLAGYLWHATQLIHGADPLADHVRYFAPRLLIDASCPDWIFPPLELLMCRIRLAGWVSWPVTQQDAVRGYLHAMWTRLIRMRPGKPDVWTLLAAIGELESDVTPLLSEWTGALQEAASARQLEWLLNNMTYDRGRWQRTDAGLTAGFDTQQVSTWLGALWEPVAQAWFDTPSAEARAVLEDLEIRLFPGIHPTTAEP